jgi:hypothetical protein
MMMMMMMMPWRMAASQQNTAWQQLVLNTQLTCSVSQSQANKLCKTQHSLGVSYYSVASIAG